MNLKVDWADLSAEITAIQAEQEEREIRALFCAVSHNLAPLNAK